MSAATRPEIDFDTSAIDVRPLTNGEHLPPDKVERERVPDREFEKSETGMAERVCEHCDAFRYVTEWKKFICWNGKRWKIDDVGLVDRIVKTIIRRTKAQASAMSGGAATELWNHAHACESNSKIKAIKERMAVERRIPISADALDADPNLTNFENGTFDVLTSVLNPHDKKNLITKMCSVGYDPDAECDLFDRFNERILPDEPVREFDQRAAGYSATGYTDERCVLMPYGNGANGKSTKLHAIGEVLGDYATTLPAESLMIRRDGGIPNDLARLKGSRFVSALETDEGRRLAESLVKQMTGGTDLITARFLYGEFFSFKPQCKIWIGTNHKPVIRGTDEAIWDRIRLIPYIVRIPEEERDRKLPEKLRAEYPGIAAWIIRGAMAWQRMGLAAPGVVTAATADYRAEMDVIGEFIAECCLTGSKFIAEATPLFETYRMWCTLHNEDAMTQRRFGTLLSERGYVSGRDSTTGRKTWQGIGLKASE